MVRISKKHSDDNVFEEIFEQFVAAVAGADSKGSSKELLTELFGEEEKIMFAKRCAALVLLLEGYSTYQVAD